MSSAVETTVSNAVVQTIKYFTTAGIVMAAIILIVGSVVVHNTAFVQRNPNFFITETLLMSLMTALPILYLGYTRQAGLVKTVLDFVLLVLKVALVHVGLQFSGVYAELFPKSA